MASRIAVGPEGRSWFAAEAVAAGGGEVVPYADADGLVWMDFADAAGLEAVLADHPAIGWVQLPWAGVEAFAAAGLFDRSHDERVGRTWTCGKGVYAEPVAEHALALTLATLRHLPDRARATTWGAKTGTSLFGLRVTVLGGGGITEAYLRLLAPFGCDVTVVRRSAVPLAGAAVVGPDRLHAVLPVTDVLVLALALTPETAGVIGAAELALLPPGAVLVNVARGAHVDTDAVLDALASGRLAGAGLDVTDPEPLPDGHPLFTAPGCIVTPHVANTPEMAKRPLGERISENVRRFGAGEPLLGLVDPAAGY